MPLTSDSSSGGRRNVFDVPAPALAAPEGAAASGRSIFAAPRATSAASDRAPTQRGRRPGRVSAMPRPRAARAAALVALACAAAAPLSVLVANHGDSQPSTERQEPRSRRRPPRVGGAAGEAAAGGRAARAHSHASVARPDASTTRAAGVSGARATRPSSRDCFAAAGRAACGCSGSSAERAGAARARTGPRAGSAGAPTGRPQPARRAPHLRRCPRGHRPSSCNPGEEQP